MWELKGILIKKKKNISKILTITQQDTGCGIPVSEQNKLFRLFTHIAGDRRHKHLSTGLGLLLSRRLARALNGDLYLAQVVKREGQYFIYYFLFNFICLFFFSFIYFSFF